MRGISTLIFLYVEAYSAIWRDSGGIVDIPEEDWMSIKTLPGAKPDPSRVFRLGTENKEVIDKKFDELHRQKKME